MPNVTVNGTVIAYPDSGTDPNNAPAQIQFAQQVAIALSKLGNAAYVAPQTMDISSDNPGTNVPIVNLAFSTVNVQSAFMEYYVYRTTSTTTVFEAGNLTAIYNPNGATNSKWDLQREYVGGADITFTMTDLGQVEFSTTALGGLNHAGTIGFSASTILQS